MPKQIDILCSETSLYNAWSIVKEKGAAGGIDGMTIQEFDKEKRQQIPLLVEELKGATKAIRRVLAECKNKRILSLEMDKDGLTTKSQKVWDGITNYYALLLPENDLESFDAYLLIRLQTIITEQADLFPKRRNR